MTEHDSKMTWEDDEFVTFQQIADLLGQKPNTISARWFPQKVLPLYVGLDCPELMARDGAKTRLTGFGAKAIARYYNTCILGSVDVTKLRDQIRLEYPVKPDTPLPSELVTAEFVDADGSEMAQSGSLQRIQSALPEIKDDQQMAIANAIFQIQGYKTEQSALSEATKKKIQMEAFNQALEIEVLKLEATKKAQEFVRQQLGE